MITNLISNNSVFDGLFSLAGLQEKMPFLLKKFPSFNKYSIEMYSQFDPTSSKIYTAWILKLIDSEIIRMPEDGEKILERLTQFDQLKKKSNFKGEKDINKYDTYADLAKVVDENLGVKTKGEEYREKLSSGMQEIYNEEGMKVIKITTPEAAAKLCRGTDWCVKDPKYSEEYLSYGPLYRFEQNGLPIALLHFESHQLMDVNDKEIEIDDDYHEPLGTEIEYAVEKIGDKDPTFFIKWDVEFRRNTNKYINVTFFIENKDIFFNDAQLAYDLLYTCRYSRSAQKVIQPYFPQLESAIIKNGVYAYRYARDMLNKRWPEAEPIIANTVASVVGYYERFIEIHGNNRWIEAEPTLAKAMSPNDVMEYAANKIKGPWPDFEDQLIKDTVRYSFYNIRRYVSWILSEFKIITEKMFNYINSEKCFIGRKEDVLVDILFITEQYGIQFPFIEKHFLKPHKASYEIILNYSKKLKKNFNADLSIIEDNIKDFPVIAVRYAQDVLNYHRFPEAEPAIIKGLIDNDELVQFECAKYLMSIVKGPWPEAENILINHPNDALRNYYLSLSNTRRRLNPPVDMNENEEENSEDFQEII